MNFLSATSAIDSAFMDLTTTDGDLKTRLRQKEDHIRAVHVDMCNIKVAAEAQKNYSGGAINAGVNSKIHKKNKITMANQS